MATSTRARLRKTPWKVFWITLCGVLTVGWNVWGALRILSPWMTVPVFGAFAVAFVLAAGRVIHSHKMFGPLTGDTKQQLVTWVGAAAAAHTAWALALTMSPELWLWWALALPALSGAEYMIACLQEYLLRNPELVRPTPNVPARLEDVAATSANASEAAEDKITRQMREALRKARLGWLRLEGIDPIGGDPRKGEAPYGVNVDVRVPPGGGPKAKGAAQLEPAMAENLAISLADVLKTDLQSDWVQIRKQPSAGLHRITIVTEDVMARIHPFTETLGWRSIHDPAPVGPQLDGTLFSLPLRQHGQAIGKSTAGKSSLFHVLLAHLTLCEDAIVWVGSVEKLYDLVAGWVECYAGTDFPLPIDWIAATPSHVLQMMVAAMDVARWRQKQPFHKRGNWPTIILLVDEASFILRNTAVRWEYQGRPVVPAQAAANIAQGAASGDVFGVWGTQRSTQDHFGDFGGDTTANMGWSAAFGSRDQAEVGRLIGDYSLPMPRHKGSFWLDAGDDQLPALVKGRYIQTTDPSKPVLHKGLTIADVAWSRRNFRRTLDHGSAVQAGRAYEERHTHMTPELMTYLTGAVDLGGVVGAGAGPKGELPAGGDPLEAEILASIGAAPGGARTPAAAGSSASTSMEEHRTNPDKVLAVLRRAEGPMGRAEILEQLAANGTPLAPQVVTNVLGDLVKQEVVKRPATNTYVLPVHAA